MKHTNWPPSTEKICCRITKINQIMIAIRVWSRNLNPKYGFRFGKKIKESNNRIMKNRFEKNQNHNNFNMKRKTNRIWKSFKKIDLNERANSSNQQADFTVFPNRKYTSFLVIFVTPEKKNYHAIDLINFIWTLIVFFAYWIRFFHHPLNLW